MPTSPPSTADVLRSIATLLDDAAAHPDWDGQAVLVRVDCLPRGPDDPVELAAKPLPPGVHPLAVLDGYVAEPACTVLGVLAEGQAWHVDDGPSGRARVVELVARDGTRVSAVRLGDGPLQVEDLTGSDAPVGEVTQALCRALGVPLRGGRPVAETAGRQPAAETAAGKRGGAS
jgi:hypothetical protein